MPRRRRPRLTDRDFISALQGVRLQGLETGRFEPLSDRETFYLRLFQTGHRPDPEDFILFPPRFHLERMQIRAEEPAHARPFTASPEPAISPA